MNDVKINISNNPWIPEYKSFSYNEEDYITVVVCLKSSCEEKRDVYTSSNQYDSLVNKILLSKALE